MDDKVSIIVPIYNVVDYLEKCINSITSQTYSNLEIILVNDGSTDNSAEICERIASLDKRIILLNKENGGLSDARNCGLKKATGKYVMFIDSDDFIEKDMVEFLYKNMINYNAEISVCGFYFYYGSEKEEVRYENVSNDYYIELTPREAMLKLVNSNNSFRMNAVNKMYLRGLFDNVKFPYKKIYEDVGTTYKVILKSKKIVYSSVPKYHYFQRPNSITKTYVFDEKERNRIEMANNMCNDVLSVYNDEEIKSAMENFCVSQYIAVLNIMIKSKKYDKKLIKETKEVIKRNKKNIYKTCSKKQKIQYTLCLLNFNLYRIVYILVSKI